MGKAYGFVEVSGVTGTIDALDLMLKTADVEFVTWERKLGGRLVTVIIQGDVSAVTQAVETAVARGKIKPVAHLIIASPHEETVKMVEMSRDRLRKQGRI